MRLIITKKQVDEYIRRCQERLSVSAVIRANLDVVSYMRKRGISWVKIAVFFEKNGVRVSDNTIRNVWLDEQRNQKQKIHNSKTGENFPNVRQNYRNTCNYCLPSSCCRDCRTRHTR